MPSLLQQSLPFVATWGTWTLAALVAVALLVVLRLGRGRPLLLPARWPGRVASAGSLAVAALAAVGLFALLGPMRTMMGQVREIGTAVGRPAGDVEFERVADQRIGRLSDLRGRVVLVNLWATWCNPCRHELPGVNRLQRDCAGRGLVVVTLSNEDRPLLLRFAERHPFSTLNVRAAQLGWLDVPGRPLSVVIDRDGVVRACMIGARSYGELLKAVEKYLPART